MEGERTERVSQTNACEMFTRNFKDLPPNVDASTADHVLCESHSNLPMLCADFHKYFLTQLFFCFCFLVFFRYVGDNRKGLGCLSVGTIS